MFSERDAPEILWGISDAQGSKAVGSNWPFCILCRVLHSNSVCADTPMCKVKSRKLVTVDQPIGAPASNQSFLSCLVLSLSLFHNCNLGIEIFLTMFSSLGLWCCSSSQGAILRVCSVTLDCHTMFFGSKLINIHSYKFLSCLMSIFIMQSWAKEVRRNFRVPFYKKVFYRKIENRNIKKNEIKATYSQLEMKTLMYIIPGFSIPA